MNRSQSREEAFKLLYSLQLIEDVSVEEQIEIFLTEEKIEDKDAIKYIKELILGINENNEKIENDIKNNIKEDWSI